MSNFVKRFDTVESKWHFTSDTHHNHSRIIQYSGRPFANVTEMNEAILDGINGMVRRDDHLVIAGDVAFGDPAPFFRRINCDNIYVVIGSHDPMIDYKTSHKIKYICDAMFLELNGQQMVITHCPHLCWDKSHYGSWNLFGHLHSGTSDKGDRGEDEKGNSLFSQVINHAKMLDIGVDGHAFMPWTFEQLKEVLDRKPGFLVKRRS